MAFKKDRKYDKKQKVNKEVFRTLKIKAKKNILDKLRMLEDEKIYNLKDLGFKLGIELKGKQIKRYLD